MIKNIANAAHEARVECLKCDHRAAVSLHEAGHFLMAKLHGRRSPIRLPSIEAVGTGWKITEYAALEVNVSGLTVEAVTDLCFGGYCAELVLYDELKLNKPDIAFWVNGDRAANDCLSLLDHLNVPNKVHYQFALAAGGELASRAVSELFKKQGMATYRKMRAQREELLALAQQIFDYWQERDFAKCDWLATADSVSSPSIFWDDTSYTPSRRPRRLPAIVVRQLSSAKQLFSCGHRRVLNLAFRFLQNWTR